MEIVYDTILASELLISFRSHQPKCEIAPFIRLVSLLKYDLIRMHNLAGNLKQVQNEKCKKSQVKKTKLHMTSSRNPGLFLKQFSQFWCSCGIVNLSPNFVASNFIYKRYTAWAFTIVSEFHAPPPGPPQPETSIAKKQCFHLFRFN